jgi:hypothetical protein
MSRASLLLRRHLLLGLLLAAAPPGHCEPVALDDAALKQVVAGKSVHIDTPLGVAIPVTYHGNGLMSGRAGILSYLLGAEQDRGRWWVADGKLCQKWFKWLDAKPSCMRLRQDGRTIYWRRDDGMTGTATLAAALPPGATTPPQGLGGPLAQDPPRASLAGPREEVRALAAGERTPRRAGVRFPNPGRGERGLASLPAPSALASAGLQAVTSASSSAWCHASAPEPAARRPELDDAAVPAMLRVARLGFDGHDRPSTAPACFAPEPPLRHVARQGLARP